MSMLRACYIYFTKPLSRCEETSERMRICPLINLYSFWGEVRQKKLRSNVVDVNTVNVQYIYKGGSGSFQETVVWKLYNVFY